MRQQYPGTFGEGAAGRSPLDAREVMELAEAGVLVFDTSVSVTETSNGFISVAPLASRQAPNVLDEHRGGSVHCSSLMRDTYELLVARAEGVFSYSLDDRGGAAGFEGDKQAICTVGRYVLVASAELKAGATSKTGVTIYDLRNKFISMSSQLPPGERVAMVLNDGGTAYVITTASTLIRFREKSTAAKLEVLLRKNLYPLAISLAAEEQCDVSEIMKLCRTYGDHLYKKGDFDGSIAQYTNTIGYLQPSYVVRRFLDPHRVRQLVLYLEALQTKGLANNDHAVLMLTCYTKMKEEEKIQRFILSCGNEPRPSQYSHKSGIKTTSPGQSARTTSVGSITAHTADGSEQPWVGLSGIHDFDANNAIDILKGAGMPSQALQLAKLSGKHSRIIELLIEKDLRYREQKAASARQKSNGRGHTVSFAQGQGGEDREASVSDLMSNLTEVVLAASSDELANIMRQHGTALLSIQPDVITALFIRLATGDLDSLRQQSSNDADRVPSQTNYRSKRTNLANSVLLQDMLRVYVDDKENMLFFLEGVLEHRRANQGAPLAPRAAETLLELYLGKFREKLKVVEQLHEDKGDKAVIKAAKKELHECEKRVLATLDGSHTDRYDRSNAMLLAHSFDCEAATRFLLDRTGQQNTDLLMRKYMESGDEKGIFKVLRREGKKDPQLYARVLGHFVQHAIPEPEDEEEEEERYDAVAEVLSLVEAEGTLSPMQVVHILSQHPELPLSVAHTYINKALSQEIDSIETLEGNVSGMAKTISQLSNGEGLFEQRSGSTTTEATPLKEKSSKSSRRMYKNNSFGNDDDDFEEHYVEHEDDFEDVESLGSVNTANSVKSADRDRLHDKKATGLGLGLDPESLAEREKWEKIRQLALKRASDHESFFAELESSEDGFDTVAAAFSKSVISLK